MLGDHCYACGQPVKGLVRHFGSIVGDFFDSVFDLDSRLLRTLGPLIFRPGYLSTEYFAGHRVRFVSPVRLFVFLCISAFLAVQWLADPITSFGEDIDLGAATSVQQVERQRDAALQGMREALAEMDGDNPGRGGIEAGIAALESEAAQRIAWLQQRDRALANGQPLPPDPLAGTRASQFRFNDRPWHPESNPVRFGWLAADGNARLNQLIGRAQANIQRVRADPALLSDAFLQSLPQTLFLLVPLFAVLLKLIYLFKRRLYMEHLIVALHSHAFLCIAILLLVLLGQVDDLFEPDHLGSHIARWLEFAVVAWMPLYLWLTQKRVYAQGLIMTSLKFGVLGLCYLVLLSIGALLNLAFALVAL
jgi:hypothetical protein